VLTVTDACHLCCSLTNAEQVLALAVHQLLGYEANVTIVEGGNHGGLRDQVTYPGSVHRLPHCQPAFHFYYDFYESL